MSNPLSEIYQTGQSVWYDNIQRKLIQNGRLAEMIQNGEIWGVTSNPSIFLNAIARTTDYDSALKPTAWSGWTATQTYEQLAIEDIRDAADLFLPIYEKTQKIDGYVSLEVNPLLANDTDKTVQEAIRLWKLVDRPNLMVKIPATPQGIPAIRAAISNGLNINVTLIFSLRRYVEVIDAFMSGLEDRLAKGLTIQNIASVASFFISRLDTKVDALLDKQMTEGLISAKKADALFGKTAIASSRIVYEVFKEKFTSGRFQHLRRQGAQIQRPLWASTSTKNPKFRDVLYVEELIAPDTVNTIPPITLDAFRDHGKARLSLEGFESESQQHLEEIGSLGISLENISLELENEGVKSFADAFRALLDSIEVRSRQIRLELGTLQESVQKRCDALEKERVINRLFEHDPTLWSQDKIAQQEILNRLGWLLAPKKSHEMVPVFESLRKQCKEEGITHALILGMGGSSLAPEVFAMVFSVKDELNLEGLEISILDSTDPVQVKKAFQVSPIEKTLYIVSSKSGTTSEVNAFFSYAWERVSRARGKNAGRHFVAITDPGTKLERLALEKGFRKVIHANPSVGGRYSALIEFGLLPAALRGVDLSLLLDRAEEMLRQCSPLFPTARNPGCMLGIILAEGTLNQKNKLTIFSDPSFKSLGSWMEQLIAESSGKMGKGIIPVDLEPALPAREYEKDRLFVYIRQEGKWDTFLKTLQLAGHPVITIQVNDKYDLGSEFFRWEFATAIACSILGVNAFDQPDVQDNKTRTEKGIAAFRTNGKFEDSKPIWENEQVKVFGTDFSEIEIAKTPWEVLLKALNGLIPGDYLAINAFVPRNSRNFNMLQNLRSEISKVKSNATTIGFGPRFLHSTGQLHKGGPASGVFMMVTYDPELEISIPDMDISFNTLIKAQALGDREALLARKRRVIHFQIKTSSLNCLLPQD